jgi:type IV pilus assembly protein PilM
LPKIGVGLDIGTSSVKLIELQGGGTIRVNRFAVVPLPEGALNSGVINNQAGVAASIREAFHQSKISQHQVIVAIAGQAVIVRHIKMTGIAMLNGQELANAIRWEAERYIPFPIDEVNFAFEVINRDNEQNELEIMLVCAHNDIINSHLQVLKEVGIQPISMDIQPFALMRVFGMENAKGQGNVALLDIGAGTSDLTIVKDGVPRFTRIIPVAGTRFTQLISNGLALGFDEAERAKISYSDALFENSSQNPESMEFKVSMVMAEGLKELALELRRSFDYYQLQQRSETITRLLVSGGGSKIRNLIPYLNNQLGIPAELGSLGMKIDCPEKMVADFYEYLPNLGVALGLALREVTAG